MMTDDVLEEKVGEVLGGTGRLTWNKMCGFGKAIDKDNNGIMLMFDLGQMDN
jgi:hypothetical protein